jgi:hypothetical protein
LTASKGSVTSVVGSWTVPAVDCKATPNGAASFWVGIDGYASNTVEQIGTDSDCNSGAQSYYAWYEFYPHLSYNINNFPVNVGDVITAQVTYSATSKLFTVTITNSSNPGQPFSVSTKLPSAELSSAEWIVEAPWSGGTLALSDFGSIPFKDCKATVNGNQLDVGPFKNNPNVYAITSVSKSGIPKASPSPIASDNTDFSVTWESPGP